MSTANNKEYARLYARPVLKIFGDVARLTASGTQGATEDPTDPRPDPQRRP